MSAKSLGLEPAHVLSYPPTRKTLPFRILAHQAIYSWMEAVTGESFLIRDRSTWYPRVVMRILRKVNGFQDHTFFQT